MCCFSRGDGPTPAKVEVTNTRIFACRHDERQVVIYAMEASIGSELAMVLPLPIRRDIGQEIEFLNLENCPQFFAELARAVDPPPIGAALDSISPPATPLPVFDVGVYEASWVPAIADFASLDVRFRLPDDVWTDLMAYHDYGFAVFKLKPGRQSVHPMGFRFATRDPSRLFFPTVHIHDGRVTPTAEFDHTLFYQRDIPALRAHVLTGIGPYVDRGRPEAERITALMAAARAWSFRRQQLTNEFEDRVSPQVAGRGLGLVRYIDGAVCEDTDLLNRLAGIIQRNWFILRHDMHGELPNRDTWISDAVPASTGEQRASGGAYAEGRREHQTSHSGFTRGLDEQH